MNQEVRDPFLEGNEIIEETIAKFHKDQSKENLIAVLESIRTRMHADGHFLIPVIANPTGDEFSFCTLKVHDGTPMMVAFTSPEEFEKGERVQVISHFIDALLKAVIDNNENGFIINPWGQSFLLTRELIEMIFHEDEIQTGKA